MNRMTREEVIEILKVKKNCFDCEGLSCRLYGDIYEGCETCSKAIDIVIEALETKEKYDKILDKILGDYPKDKCQGNRMIELEQALESIRALREFCKQTSLEDCVTDMCLISGWCKNMRYMTRLPEEWSIRGE